MTTKGPSTAVANGPQRGTVARQEFGAQQLSVIAETASTAVAAKARASIEARYVMALQRPRDMDQVRSVLLHECQRPGFAKTARYAKPVGGNKVVGPSIRFAEAAIRAMGNIAVDPQIVYDDDDKRILNVTVTDLESNTTYSRDLAINKTVERRAPRGGEQVLRRRVNSSGEPTFLVRATDDDLANKEGAMVSKTIRTSGLRLLPADIIEECMGMVAKTTANEDAKDPDAARKEVFDGYARLGVTPAHLKEYLGHDGSVISPTELDDLRTLWAAIRDGEASWAEALDLRNGERAQAGQDTPQAAPAKPTDLGGLNAKLRSRQQQRDAAPAQPAPAPTEEAGAAEAEWQDPGPDGQEPPPGALAADDPDEDFIAPPVAGVNVLDGPEEIRDKLLASIAALKDERAARGWAHANKALYDSLSAHKGMQQGIAQALVVKQREIAGFTGQTAAAKGRKKGTQGTLGGDDKGGT